MFISNIFLEKANDFYNNILYHRFSLLTIPILTKNIDIFGHFIRCFSAVIALLPFHTLIKMIENETNTPSPSTGLGYFNIRILFSFDRIVDRHLPLWMPHPKSWQHRASQPTFLPLRWKRPQVPLKYLH